MARVFLVIVFLVVISVCQLDAAKAKSKKAKVAAPSSCMVKWLRKAGAVSAKANRYEKNLLRAKAGAAVVKSTHPQFLRFHLKTTLVETKSIRNCILRSAKACKKYYPCLHQGECVYSAPGKAFVCKCHSDFQGTFCQTPNAAPVREFHMLQKQVQSLQKIVAMKDKRLDAMARNVKHNSKALNPTTSCIGAMLGHRTWSWYQKQVSTYSGRVRRVHFVKIQDITGLRITYSTNVAMHSSGHYERLYVLIDGHECAVPSKIDIYLRHGYSGWRFQPVVLRGTCFRAGGGTLRKGKRRVDIYIAGNDGNTNSGKHQLSELRVQEVCKSNQ